MKKYTKGQMQYIMRKQFSIGVDIFKSNICKGQEQLEISLMSLRRLCLYNKGQKVLFEGIQEPLFWFRECNSDLPFCYQPNDKSYFIGPKNINIVTLPGPDSLYKHNIKEVMKFSDEHVIEHLMEKKDYQGYRDKAFLNSLLIRKNPTVCITLKEYLDEDPNKDLWRQRFPGMIETNVTDKDLYGDLVAKSVAELLELFLGTTGERNITPEERKQIDDIFK